VPILSHIILYYHNHSTTVIYNQNNTENLWRRKICTTEPWWSLLYPEIVYSKYNWISVTHIVIRTLLYYFSHNNSSRLYHISKYVWNSCPAATREKTAPEAHTAAVQYRTDYCRPLLYIQYNIILSSSGSKAKRDRDAHSRIILYYMVY